MRNKVYPDEIYYDSKFERLCKYSSDIVLTVNPDGEVLKVNDNALHIFKSHVEGRKINELFDGMDSFIDLVQDTNVIRSLYVHHISKDKDIHPFKLTIVPVIERGSVREVIVIGGDLKEIESFRGEVERLKKKVKSLNADKLKLKKGKINTKDQNMIAAALRKLESANQKLEEVNKNITRELEMAALLQKSLIPTSLPANKFLQFAFHFEPMGFVGGDYYDIIDLGGERKGVIVADVSGHGVSSAFIATMLKISFVNFAAENLSPSKLLYKLNKTYCDLIQTSDYVTAFYAVFDPVKRKMTYSGAGHPRPLLLCRKTDTIDFLRSKGFFLGMFEGAEYTDTTIDFTRGDRYLVYTDGIIEAYSEEKKKQFGSKELLRGFEMYRNKPIDILLNSIISDVKKFMKKSQFYDDLAMVAVEYK